jgi:hypothetical protein
MATMPFAGPPPPPSMAAEDPTGWWEGPYGGAPWAPTASAGSSGAHGNLIANTGFNIAPNVGAAINGVTPADMSTPHAGDPPTLIHSGLELDTGGPASVATLIGAPGHAFTIIVLVQASAAPGAPSGAFYNDGFPIIIDTGGWFGLTETTSGVRAGVDGPLVATPFLPVTPGDWYMAAARLAGGFLKLRVNGTDAAPVACAGPGGSGTSLVMGTAYSQGSYLKGMGMAYVIYDYGVSNAQLDAWDLYFKAKYPAMGLP